VPQGIQFMLADLGETVTFDRGLLVEDGPPLQLELQLRTSEEWPFREFFTVAMALLVFIIGGMVFAGMNGRSRVSEM